VISILKIDTAPEGAVPLEWIQRIVYSILKLKWISIL